MFYVYILKNQKTDLKNRLHEHNTGQSFATKPYIPWKLMFYAAFETEFFAKNFEKYLKTGSGWGFARKRFVKVD